MRQQRNAQGNNRADSANSRYFGNIPTNTAPNTTNHPTTNPKGMKMRNKTNTTLPNGFPFLHSLY